jgi:HlyD family secretion protein
MEELISEVSQKRFALEKARNEAKANIVDAQAKLNAARERLVRDEQNLKEINDQIDACTVVAPRAGLVVYGTTGRYVHDSEQPLAEGVEVREQMDLFRLPTSDGLVAEIKVHESTLEKVREGQPVRITSDAVPGRLFTGRISRIAVLPDAQSWWLNPDLKVYLTHIELTGDTTGLRTGMTCKTEIIVREFDDTLSIPIQTVVRVGGRPTVYIPDQTGSLLARPVELGMDDNQMIQILSGLKEGDRVTLTPPLQEGQRPLREQSEPDPVEQPAPPPDSAASL